MNARNLFLLLGIICMPANFAMAQDADRIGWSITPYLWASDTSVDLTFRDTNIGAGKLSFDDLMDIVETSFMVHLEGGKGNWSAFADVTYLDTSDTEQRTLLTVDTDSKQRVVDAAVAYWPKGSGTPLNFYGGLRYTSFDDRYTFSLNGTELGTQRSTDAYSDVLLGVRYRFDLADKWALLTQADYNFGDSEGGFMLRGNFAYTVGSRQQNRILFGYQYKQADFKDGDLTTAFTYAGPMAGFNFRF